MKVKVMANSIFTKGRQFIMREFTTFEEAQQFCDNYKGIYHLSILRNN